MWGLYKIHVPANSIQEYFGGIIPSRNSRATDQHMSPQSRILRGGENKKTRKDKKTHFGCMYHFPATCLL